MTSPKVAKAIEVAQELKRRVQTTNSVTDAHEATQAWRIEIRQLGDAQLTQLAEITYDLVRHIQVTNRAEVAESQGDTFMGDQVSGDKYQTGQAGAVGPKSHAENMTFNQSWQQYEDIGDLPQFAIQLADLRKAMKIRTDGSVGHDNAIAAVGNAEEAAKAGDSGKMMECLKSAGAWAVDVAKDVTSSVVADVIKKSMGVL